MAVHTVLVNSGSSGIGSRIRRGPRKDRWVEAEGGGKGVGRGEGGCGSGGEPGAGVLRCSKKG